MRIGDDTPDLVALGASRGRVDARVLERGGPREAESLANDRDVAGIVGQRERSGLTDERQAVRDEKRLDDVVERVLDLETSRVEAVVLQFDGEVAASRESGLMEHITVAVAATSTAVSATSTTVSAATTATAVSAATTTVAVTAAASVATRRSWHSNLATNSRVSWWTTKKKNKQTNIKN